MTRYNTSGIENHRQLRSEEKRQNALKAIKYLQSKNEVVSFQSVAKEAKVTRQYLYKNAELRKKIEEIRPISIQANNDKVVKFNPKLVSLEAKYKALTRRYKAVLQELEDKKSEVASLRTYIEEITS